MLARSHLQPMESLLARPIIIDTDPGQDDAIAILLALASPELEVLGITTVAGNVPLPLTQKNARKVCELAGRPDVKVFAGCPRPLVRPLRSEARSVGQECVSPWSFRWSPNY